MYADTATWRENWKKNQTRLLRRPIAQKFWLGDWCRLVGLLALYGFVANQDKQRMHYSEFV